MKNLVSLLRAYHDALNAFDLRQVESMFAPDVSYSSPILKSEINGRDKLILAMRKYFAEFSDQVSRDTNIEVIDTSTVKSTWALEATSAISGEKRERRGEETVTFDQNDFIIRVEVVDYD
jgi:ketosteroid isomerase-like protein